MDSDEHRALKWSDVDGPVGSLGQKPSKQVIFAEVEEHRAGASCPFPQESIVVGEGSSHWPVHTDRCAFFPRFQAEGSFIELVGSSDKDDELVLPAGASLRYLKLDAPLVIVLPEPTTAYFWFDTGNGSRSFQGPCDLPKQ